MARDDRLAWGRGWLVLPLAIGLAGLEGCAQYIGTTATSFMKHAREDRDPNLRHLAYAKLADSRCYDDDSQKSAAVALLSARLNERKEPVITRALICRTLGEIGQPEAREALRKACDDEHPIIRAAACRSLGKLGNDEDIPVLARTMAADRDSDCRIAAIEGLGSMHNPEKRVCETLAEGMANPDPAIRLASYLALQKLTNKDMGPDYEAWKKYFADQPSSTEVLVENAAKPAPDTAPSELDLSIAPASAPESR